MTLTFTDNMRGDRCQSLKDLAANENEDELEKLKGVLLQYSHKPLKDLEADHPGLIVFPQDASTYCDEAEENWLYGFVGEKIETGNLMGSFGVGGHDIRIRSRFDAGEDRPYFMYYLLQKVMGLNVLDLPSRTDSDPISELCVFLFPTALQRAVAKGVFKAYRRFEYNDAKVKGPIDISRHLRLNVPFRGDVAYSMRERTVNNPMIQLVRHAIEFIKTGPFREILTRGDREVKDAVNIVVSATPTYARQERSRIIGQNLRPVRHPYYSEYTLLQKISLQILRHEKVSHGSENDELKGIVFDGAWLWEEYLNVVLQNRFAEKGHLRHPKNKTREDPIHIYKPRKGGQARKPIYPDFLFAHIDSDGQTWDVALDAKYKRSYYQGKDGKYHFGVLREDRYQVISYMYLTAAKSGVFLCPMSEEEKSNADREANADDESCMEKVKDSYIEGSLLGHGGRVAVVPFVVPSLRGRGTFKDYCESMGESEKSFCDNLSAIISPRDDSGVIG